MTHEGPDELDELGGQPGLRARRRSDGRRTRPSSSASSSEAAAARAAGEVRRRRALLHGDRLHRRRAGRPRRYGRVLGHDAEARTVTVRGRHHALRAVRRARPRAAWPSRTWATSPTSRSPAPPPPPPTARAGTSATSRAASSALRLIAGDGSIVEATPSENPEVLDVGPRRARRARDRVDGDAAGRARVPAARHRGADAGRRACSPTSTATCRAPTTSSSTGCPTPGGRSPSATAAPTSRRSRGAGSRSSSTTIAPAPTWRSARCAASAAGGPASSRGWPRSCRRPAGSSTPTAATGSSPARASCTSTRWSTRIPREAIPEALNRVRRARRRARHADQLPGRGARGRARRHPAVDGARPGHRLHRGARVPRHALRRSTSRASSAIMNDYGGRPHWGKMRRRC